MRKAPSQTQIEINLFGGGSAYGEALLIHLGYNKWIVIDSLKNPSTKSSVILEYLKEIDVKPKNIELIVASHWHDDHIKGISEIYEASGCTFSISQAMSSDHLTKLVSINEFKESSNSGLNEFENVVRLSIKQGNALKRAIQDRLLIDLEESGCKVKVTALSPSDESISAFEKEIAGLLNEAFDFNLTLKKTNPNHSSVVLLIQIDQTNILLGADLEITSNSNMGWQQVCKSSSLPRDNNIEVFKIPHHGSINGHFDPLWDKFISNDDITILTPYGRGRKKLPSKEDQDRILSSSEQSYITSKGETSSKPKKRDPKVNKILKDFSYSVKERKFSFGQIQLRRDVKSQKSDVWDVNLYGCATDLKDFKWEK